MPRTDTCPPWCDDHYTGAEGDTVHAATTAKTAYGTGTYSGAPMYACVWIEQRDPADGSRPEVVGVIQIEHDDPRPSNVDPENRREDIDLSRTGLIRFADFCLRVAAEIDEAEARFAPASRWVTSGTARRTRNERARRATCEKTGRGRTPTGSRLRQAARVPATP